MKQSLALAGIIGGLFWVCLAFFPPVGVRETRDYEILWNRLWTPALVCMGLGFIGLFQTFRAGASRSGKIGMAAMLIGLVLMIGSNFTEYWMLSALPHEGPNGIIRGVVWMTFLAGTLLMLLATAITGITMMRTEGFPRWLSLLFVLMLPLTIAIGFVSLNWAGTPIGILSIIVGSFGLRPRTALHVA